MEPRVDAAVRAEGRAARGASAERAGLLHAAAGSSTLITGDHRDQPSVPWWSLIRLRRAASGSPARGGDAVHSRSLPLCTSSDTSPSVWSTFRIALPLSLDAGDLVQANRLFGARDAVSPSTRARRSTRSLATCPTCSRLSGARTTSSTAGLSRSWRVLISALEGETSSLSSLDGPGIQRRRVRGRGSAAGARSTARPSPWSASWRRRFRRRPLATEAFKPLPGLFYNVWHRFYRALARQARPSDQR